MIYYRFLWTILYMYIHVLVAKYKYKPAPSSRQYPWKTDQNFSSNIDELGTSPIFSSPYTHLADSPAESHVRSVKRP